MSSIDLKQKSKDDLTVELGALIKEQFNLKMQKSTGQLQKSHLVKQVRRNIARIKTMLTELAEVK
jgi:large subunit ribosomal protein L29